MAFAVLHSMAHFTVGLCVENSWRLEARCLGGHVGGWNAGQLGEAFPAETPLSAIADRLKCSTCGNREGRLLIVQDHGAARARDRERIEREGR